MRKDNESGCGGTIFYIVLAMMALGTLGAIGKALQPIFDFLEPIVFMIAVIFAVVVLILWISGALK